MARIVLIFFTLVCSFSLIAQNNCPSISLGLETNNGLDYLTEGCHDTPAQFVIKLDAASDQEIKITLDISGSATTGDDYSINVPDTLVFSPGSQMITLDLIPIGDAEMEGNETIIISISSIIGCENANIEDFVINLYEELQVSIQSESDTIHACGGVDLDLSVGGASTYTWEPADIFSSNTGESVTLNSSTDGWVTVTGNSGTCSNTDMVYIKFYTPEVSASTNDPTEICSNQSISLESSNNTNGQGFSWMPADGITNPKDGSIQVNPQQTTDFRATISLANCRVEDTVHVEVDKFDFPTIPSMDVSVCQGSDFQLTNPEDNRETMYDWSPGIYLSDSTIASPYVIPEKDTTYTLIATSARGFCADTAVINVKVVEIDVTIQAVDTMKMCKGESVSFDASTVGDNLVTTWSFRDSLIGNISNFSYTPSISRMVRVHVQNAECEAFDSVYLRVDSLPDISEITVTPEKDPYCVGDEIIFYSGNVDKALYPDITHSWSPNLGFVKGPESSNQSLSAQAGEEEEILYTRTTMNHACQDIDSVTINVVNPEIPLSVEDTTVCPGEPVEVEVLEEGIEDLKWTPETNITPTEGEKVTISPTRSGTWEVMGEKKGCPASGSVDVNVPLFPQIAFAVGPAGSVPVGTQVTISVTSDAQGPLIFDWDGRSEVTNTIIVSRDTEGDEQFRVTITDANGCEWSADVTINWFIPPFMVKIPNAFTPNGDDDNDFFQILVEGNAAMEQMLVFNRWGQVVFNGKGADVKWDGKQGSSDAPADVYAYLIKVRNPENKIENHKGSVTLMR